jgi:alkanesulfonate monooxygenase SsuD/methylene tetrahydromethanopterin reductase-like flavin-dependent oxidoreductase (luciferase family)
VKLGLGVYSAEWIPSEGITHHQVYANDLEQAKLAEQVGLDSIWYTEHHFLNWNPNVMGMCAAVAAVTSRIQLGPSVVLAPLHNPIKLAEECAMLDVLSNGRFTIGVGLGYRDVEYAGFNVRRAVRAPMTEELVQVMKLAWSEEPVTFKGKHWSFDKVDVYPKPLQAGGPIPSLSGRAATTATSSGACRTWSTATKRPSPSTGSATRTRSSR